MNITIIRANALGTPRVAKTAKVLTEAGHSVTIVRWERQIRDDTNKYAQYLTGVDIVSIKTVRARANAFYRSLFGRIEYLIKIFGFALSHRKEADIFHCVDFDSAFPVYVVKLFHKEIHYNYDIADYLQDYDTKAPSLVIRFLSNLDKRVRKRANVIFIPHNSRIDRIENTDKSKTVVVNNAPDIEVDEIRSIEPPISITNNKINIIYYGVLSKDRGIEYFLHAANCLWHKYHFYIAGTGALQDIVEQNEHIHYLGELQYYDCMAVLAQMDLCYAFYDANIKVNRHAAPNKFYEAVLFNTPIVAAMNTGIDENVAADNIGFVAGYSQNELIDLLCGLNSNIISEVKKGMVRCKDKYSYAESKDNLKQVYS